MSDEPWYVVVATLGPLVAAIGAIGALIVGILTVRQRTAADSRAQWWARVQWAVDLSFSPDESKRAIGLDALVLLASSPLAGPDDDAFLAGLSLDVLDAAEERGAGDDADFVPADDDLTPGATVHARPVVGSPGPRWRPRGCAWSPTAAAAGPLRRGSRGWPRRADQRGRHPIGQTLTDLSGLTRVTN